jgi:ATP-dependent Clp protease protease subunit
MSDETWLNAKKAVELGFADEILFADKPKPDEESRRNRTEE